jgi:hypothetical protein
VVNPAKAGSPSLNLNKNKYFSKVSHLLSNVYLALKNMVLCTSSEIAKSLREKPNPDPMGKDFYFK